MDVSPIPKFTAWSERVTGNKRSFRSEIDPYIAENPSEVFVAVDEECIMNLTREPVGLSMNLLRKSHFCSLFRLFSLNSRAIAQRIHALHLYEAYAKIFSRNIFLIEQSKNCNKNGFLSQRSTKSDRLLAISIPHRYLSAIMSVLSAGPSATSLYQSITRSRKSDLKPLPDLAISLIVH